MNTPEADSRTGPAPVSIPVSAAGTHYLSIRSERGEAA